VDRYRPSGDLIVAGQTFRVDAPIINFREPPFWDATREYCVSTTTESSPRCLPGGVPYGHLPVPYARRYGFRPALRSFYDDRRAPPLDIVKAVIRQFVVHHDGCSSADMCFNVLHNERGLSVHFLLDNDGTIYQTIDLALCAYHAAEWNDHSIGIELCNRGDAFAEPHYYDSGHHGPKRDIRTIQIHGHTMRAFDYTPAQKDSFVRLCKALAHILPNVPAEFPQSSPGTQAWTALPPAQSLSFHGYLGHYHLTARKWDPGPFDFKDFCRRLRGAFCFPVFVTDDAKRNDDDKPVVPQQTDELADATKQLYRLNEARADGGFFPVGPWGDSRLWHGGVHLVGGDRDPVFAPLPGRLIAARMGKSCAIGSVNFALLRHDLALGASRVPLYSLYMHLADELTELRPVEWLTRRGWKQAGVPGQVLLLDEPIEAGAQIGRIGRAGPEGLAKPQIHVEFFSPSELFTDLPGTPWQTIDGTAGGRFCDSKQIDDAIDRDHDRTLSRQELSQFYRGGGAAQLHFVVPLHVSEWTGDPSWSDALRVPKDFKKYKPSEIEQLVADQITPALWWDDSVAAHCQLPADGIVYHYHPVAFLGWFHQQLLDGAAAAGSMRLDDNAARSATASGLKDDLADRDGTSMRSSASITEDPCNSTLTLEQLVRGFDAPECGEAK
jgi:N-acetyl-anhydromuramyl-L-alanine amidase AmpD